MSRRILGTALATVLAGAVAALARPANDECASATAIASLPFSESLDVSAATSNPTDPLLPCVFQLPIGDGSVWYTYTASERTVLDIDTRASTYRTTVAAWGGGCGVFERLACSAFELAPGTGEWGEEKGRAFVTVEAGQTVHIEVASEFGALGTLQLAVGHAVAGHPAPIGPEFVVNENETPYEQGQYIYAGTIDACRAANGDFVVAWQSCCGQDGDDTGVFARRFGADGTPLGGELQVNTYTTLYQERPSIGCGSAGEFVVTWQDSSYGVKARLYDDTGSPITGEIPVGVGDLPDVDMDAGGAFVVAFREAFDVRVRRFDATGAPTTVATSLGADSGARPDISMTDAGDAVVAWEQYDASAHARRLDATGAPIGRTIVVATPTNDYVRDPAVSINESGAFVVVWEDYGFPIDETRARTFSPSDVPGPVLSVSAFQNFNIIDSDVALDDDGTFVVTWSDYFYTFDVFARRMRADGTKIGDTDFEIPTVAAGTRAAAHVTDAVGGEFVVAWVGEDGEVQYPTDAYFGGGYGVRAQRFTFAPTVGPACPSAPSASCKQPTIDFKGTLKIKDTADDQGDRFLWKWVNGDEVLLAEFGDPLGDDGVAVCLYDAGTLVTEARLPGGGTCDGKPCWKAVNGGVLYKDTAAANGGVKKLLMKAADAGKAKLVVKAKGASLQTPSLPLELPAVMQLHGTSGACWSAEFRPEGVQKNVADAFGGQAQASAP